MMKLKREWMHNMACAVATGIAVGYPYRIETTIYELQEEKLSEDINICLLTDIHNDLTDKKYDFLIKEIQIQQPDLILLSGDIFDYKGNEALTFSFLKELAHHYPVFYVTGNHELVREDIMELYDAIEAVGVTVLDDCSKVITVKNQTIELGGFRGCLYEESIASVTKKNLFKTENMRILLSHCPHLTNLYRSMNVDYIVCGHAHGGQWRIPFLDIPCAAPQQGIFPEYTNGIYPMNHAKMIVSRGIVHDYHGIPRLFNHPEIVFIKLKGKGSSISN